MSIFQTYLQLGFQHILNWQAIDHLLFILAITCIFTWDDLKHLLWLVTAFTIGHSITLALATIGWLNMNPSWIEFLIPCTILVAAISNLIQTEQRYKYGVVAFFGLIHGLGFSNYLQSLLGAEGSLFTPLLAFNLGLELGQILVVSLVLIFTTITSHVFHWKQKTTIAVLSGITIGLVLPMIIERWP